RVRMGAAPERPLGDFVAYVLGRFRDADLDAVVDMVDRAAEAVHTVLREGLEPAMNRYNKRQ
ncbi:MAG TPA: aminoacyl-tRNA hydrolase, partial [Terriglobia bacterium]|nr:aminoacyl-tRNA hydrolase [Terriglobia bacterium]